MADFDLAGIRSMVQDAIDKGATSVEDVHKQIAAMPLDALKNLGGPASSFAESAQGFLNSSIGSVYDTIRQVNEKVGEIAQQMLANVPGAGGSKEG